MVANVLSWCGSRLGASAAMAASKTPPRRGVSDACAAADAAETREPISTQNPTRAMIVRWRCMSILRQPHVLELLIGEVTRRSHPVFHLGPVHDVPRPPEPRDLVRVVQRDFLQLDDEPLALGRVERPRLTVVQVVDRRAGEATPVLRGAGDERREQRIGMSTKWPIGDTTTSK